jgi:hypothetical protein
MVLLSNFENPDDVLDNWAWKHRKCDDGWVNNQDMKYLKDQFYEYLQSHQNLDMEVHVFKLVAFPEQEPEFVKYCDEQATIRKRKSKNPINQASIARYLGVNHCNVYNCLKHLQKIFQKFQEESDGRRVTRTKRAVT